MITPVMLVYPTLHLALIQLLLCTLISTAPNSMSNSLPSPSLLERPVSHLVFSSNESFTNPNGLPADPSYVPWPSTGLNQGIVKLFDYGSPISPSDANEVLTELARVYHGQPPKNPCGTMRRAYTASTVTLVLEPSSILTWGVLARSGYVFPTFLSRFEYVGFKFEIWTLAGVLLGKGYMSKVQ